MSIGARCVCWNKIFCLVNYFNSLKKRDKKSSLLILALTGCCTGQVNYK